MTTKDRNGVVIRPGDLVAPGGDPGGPFYRVSSAGEGATVRLVDCERGYWDALAADCILLLTSAEFEARCK